MSLRHLRVLLALDTGGSVSAAAELLHVTQPAVSKALAELEQELGITLFARRGRGFRATPLCERLLALGRKLESDLRRGAEDAASIARGASGALLIGATNAALAQVLPDAMAAMKRDFPQVTLSVRTHAVSDLFAELRAGRLDLVVARTPDHDMVPDLAHTSLGSTREVLVISQLHPLARERQVTWAQLNEQGWVWHLPGTRSRALRDTLWQRMGLPLPNQLIETGDTMLALSMLRRLPLLAILPEPVARMAAQRELVKILPLAVEIPLSDLMMWHLPEPQSELVTRFKALMCEAALNTAPPLNTAQV
ncbi:LysR family transcriptional regulator [Roseateles sp. BYS180W]|uniref:LysR family transcriptional regulator n=2 Tax=Roseateles rivi TaxID=3299028 RepID=A0ABW7FQT3_9BURK